MEMPQVYARWQSNHEDASIPSEWRKELAKLHDPHALAPTVKETAEPILDDGFKALGIVE